jgi:hypothetical protein
MIQMSILLYFYEEISLVSIRHGSGCPEGMKETNVKSTARKNRAGKILVALMVVSAAVFGGLPEARATEGGGGVYPNGGQGFLAGALPPHGLYFIEYLQHYSRDALMDGKRQQGSRPGSN